ncbi:hypothetical protein NQ314_010861 [Rhamnusium bicolor]|uniref:Uncharacterized protein n=1 Tax=Rhamnusium bicolor TaxID=1586634 RepID=A0AAV8XN58_9CUCU|nr:hypothetical protein NQ314_010861 [Rhamnusium bicolor]
MKFLVIIVFVFGIIDSINTLPTSVTTRIGAKHLFPNEQNLADGVKGIIDTILDIIPETLKLTNITFAIPNNTLLTGTVNINKISLSGLKSPNIETITYDDEMSRLDYELNFEDVHTEVDVTLDLKGLIPITNHFSIIIDLLNLDGKGYALVSHDPKTVTDFNISVNLEKIVTDVKELPDDDVDLSQMLSVFINENGVEAVGAFLQSDAPDVKSVFNNLVNSPVKINLNYKLVSNTHTNIYNK